MHLGVDVLPGPATICARRAAAATALSKKPSRRQLPESCKRARVVGTRVPRTRGSGLASQHGRARNGQDSGRDVPECGGDGGGEHSARAVSATGQKSERGSSPSVCVRRQTTHAEAVYVYLRRK
jgi:hypothetical protein